MFLTLQLSASKKIISRVDVDLILENAPKVTYRRVSDIPVKTGSVNRWLVIRIWYEPEKVNPERPVLRKGRGGYDLQMNGFVDDLGVRVTVLQDTGLLADGKPLYCKYTGETAFYTVRRDGKKHLVMMFIPGKLLDRFSRSANGAVRSVSKNDFKAEIIFTVDGKNAARAYYGGNAKTFSEALSMVPVNMVFERGVFPRLRTPWALFEADEFDLEKEFPVGKI
jgi:hypothetical protein